MLSYQQSSEMPALSLLGLNPIIYNDYNQYVRVISEYLKLTVCCLGFVLQQRNRFNQLWRKVLLVKSISRIKI